MLLPQMLGDSNIQEVLSETKHVVQTGGQSIILAEIIVLLLLGISLKSLWNLLNVIQVLSYMRFYTNWPIFMREIFVYIDNTITLKPLIDPIFELGKDNFEIAKQKL